MPTRCSSPSACRPTICIWAFAASRGSARKCRPCAGACFVQSARKIVRHGRPAFSKIGAGDVRRDRRALRTLHAGRRRHSRNVVIAGAAFSHSFAPNMSRRRRSRAQNASQRQRRPSKPAPRGQLQRRRPPRDARGQALRFEGWRADDRVWPQCLDGWAQVRGDGTAWDEAACRCVGARGRAIAIERPRQIG